MIKSGVDPKVSQSLIHQGENSILPVGSMEDIGLNKTKVSIPYSSGGKFNQTNKVKQKTWEKILPSQSLIHQGENSILPHGSGIDCDWEMSQSLIHQGENSINRVVN